MTIQVSGWFHSIGLEFTEDEMIKGIQGPILVFGFGQRCFHRAFEGPVRFVFATGVHPLPEYFAVIIGEFVSTVRWGHDVIGVMALDPQDEFAVVCIARFERPITSEIDKCALPPVQT